MIGVLETRNSLLIAEYNGPTYFTARKGTIIGQLMKLPQSAKYSFTQNTWIQVKTTLAQEMETKHKDDKPAKTMDELLPPQYQQYQKIFTKEASECFPTSKPYNHAINLKPDFIPQDCKVYPLTLGKQAKLDECLEENLPKNYIFSSKSPMASPFFFISKKDGSLHPCQDY